VIGSGGIVTAELREAMRFGVKVIRFSPQCSIDRPPSWTGKSSTDCVEFECGHAAA
jgi:hypothetical protein